MFSLYRNSGLFYRKGIILPFSLHLNRQEIYLIKEGVSIIYMELIKGVLLFNQLSCGRVNFNGRVYAYRTGKAVIIAKVGKEN